MTDERKPRLEPGVKVTFELKPRPALPPRYLGDPRRQAERRRERQNRARGRRERRR